jgi:hypothetical protein
MDKTTAKNIEITVAQIETCRDGARMVLKREYDVYALSNDEVCRLIEAVVDEFGDDLPFDQFAEAVHGFIEDIPGLETMAAEQANSLIVTMWSQYHGENQR